MGLGVCGVRAALSRRTLHAETRDRDECTHGQVCRRLPPRSTGAPPPSGQLLVPPAGAPSALPPAPRVDSEVHRPDEPRPGANSACDRDHRRAVQGRSGRRRGRRAAPTGPGACWCPRGKAHGCLRPAQPAPARPQARAPRHGVPPPRWFRVRVDRDDGDAL